MSSILLYRNEFKRELNMMHNFTIVDRFVLGSISGGFTGNLFCLTVERYFFTARSEKINQKRFLLDAILASVGIGLFLGMMTFTVISFEPKNIEGYNFVGVFFCAFCLSSVSVFANILELIYSKIFASSNSD